MPPKSPFSNKLHTRDAQHPVKGADKLGASSWDPLGGLLHGANGIEERHQFPVEEVGTKQS